MSTEATPAPAGIVTPAVVVAQPPKVEDDDSIKLTSAQLKERLDRSSLAQLKKLGFKDEAEAEAYLAAVRAKEEGEKSEVEKLKGEVKKLTKAEAKAAALEAELAEIAKASMKGLSAEQRAAVKELADDDPAAQLKAIRVLQPTWKQEAAETAKTKDEAPKVPVKTVPTGSPPSAETSTAAPDHKAVWTEMRAKDPRSAAVYLNEHLQSIFPDK